MVAVQSTAGSDDELQSNGHIADGHVKDDTLPAYWVFGYGSLIWKPPSVFAPSQTLLTYQPTRRRTAQRIRQGCPTSFRSVVYRSQRDGRSSRESCNCHRSERLASFSSLGASSVHRALGFQEKCVDLLGTPFGGRGRSLGCGV